MQTFIFLKRAAHLVLAGQQRVNIRQSLRAIFYREQTKMHAMKRNFTDRRSGKSRRRIFRFYRSDYNGPNRRNRQDRRSQLERRDGYVRIDKWSSVNVHNLKISKYLRPH